MVRSRLRADDGFTLVELLVVILIIGILAAIALPAFLGQRKKGQDADAKSNARNLVSEIESCFTSTEDYTTCDTAADLDNPSVPIGTGGGNSSITATGATTGYTVVGTSKSANTFTISKSGTGVTRSCQTQDDGGCKASGTW